MSERESGGWQRPSIYDVAKHAGVSHMTVSRVLNNHPNIRESTRDRVLRAIEEMHYTPSSIARALATKRAMRIGVIIDSPVQYGPSSTLHALEHAARAAGYAIGVLDLVTQGVDALCVIAPRVSSLHVLRKQITGVPILVVKAEPEASMHTVAVDQHAGGVLAVRHLIELGHHSIAHLAGPLDWFDALGRLQGWRETLEAAGLPVAPPLIGDWTSDCGHEFGRNHDFGDATAIFAANDQMALGLVHGLAERGVRVPEDISVVGFDDLPDARHFLPPLTTVRQDFAALGSLALQQLLLATEGEDVVAHDRIQPLLIERESSGPPRHGP
jgi:DNA-binding LacI/PurR family transcriptional regulator